MIHSAGSGRLTAPMKLRSAMKHQAGIIDQARPEQIAGGERGRFGDCPAASRMSSPHIWMTLIGTPRITAAHRPMRSERRTMRGSRAP